jgi:hypothetical protein
MADISIDSDSGKFKAGDGQDLNLYHNGTNSFIENETGILYVTNKANTSLILGTNNTTAVTIDNSQNVTMAANITIPAGNAIFLDGGGNSKVEEFATDKVNIQAGGENLVVDGSGSAVLVGIGLTAPKTTLEVGAVGGAHVTLSHTPTNASDIADNDLLGQIDFAGYDTDYSGDFIIGARIKAQVDGTWDASGGGNVADAPTELQFITVNSDTSHDISHANNLNMVIKSDGKVGIGTSSPDSHLHIKESSDGTNAVFHLEAAGGSGTENAIIRLTNPSDAWDIYCEDNTGSGDLRFYNGADRVTIEPGGNVGIGTTAPNNELTISSGSGPTLAIGRMSTISDTGVLGNIVFQGSENSGSNWGLGAQIRAKVTQDWTEGSAEGTKLEFFTTDNSSATRDLRVTIDHNGNVGIGTDGPQDTLDIYGGADGNSGMRITSTGSGTGSVTYLDLVHADGNYRIQNQADKFGIYDLGASAMRMQISTGGCISIGTTGTGDIGNTTGLLVEKPAANDAVGFQVKDTDTAVDSNNVIGQFAFSADDNANAGKFLEFADSGGVIGNITADGAGNIAVGGTSDERLKKDIEDVSDSLLDEINKIKVRKFQWNHRPANFHIGLIAQELEKIVPKAVNKGGDDPKKQPYSVAYTSLVPYLIKAVQELSAKVEALENA